MVSNYLIVIFILSIAAIASVKTQKLTFGGGLTGWVCAVLVFIGAGYTGVAMMAAFFIMATVATSFGLAEKQHLGIAEKDRGRRTAGQVIANAGVAALLGLLIWLFPQKALLFQLMIAASLASATADTLSSELGNAYGTNFFHILTFKKDRRGLDGVVSAEGTFFGAIGSAVIAVIHGSGYGWNWHYLLIIIIAGTIGNLTDSVLGGTVERKGLVNNNTVNFLNTATAALTALLLF
jgi:uncharacterized protein (TIGR00297 family)